MVRKPGNLGTYPRAPEILGANYFWEVPDQLNIKYMKAKTGLDYDNNIQSNRTLYA